MAKRVSKTESTFWGWVLLIGVPVSCVSQLFDGETTTSPQSQQTKAQNSSYEKTSVAIRQMAEQQATASSNKPEPAANEASEANQCKLEGKVIKVPDGDSITVLDSRQNQHSIRLAGIDSPERGQPFVKASTKFLRNMISGKTVCVDWYKYDKYKRKLGTVRLDGQDVGYQVVKAGYAWHYKEYQDEQSPEDRKLYSDAEKAARSATIGLWSEPNPIYPSDWRDGKRPVVLTKVQKAAAIEKQRLSTVNSGFTCSGKRYCKEMVSCAEARFYLTQCGVSRLDRDKDGIPCESIC